MNFNLQKALVFFDLEATGLNVITDRIIQIGMVKYLPDESQPVEYERLINPDVPISKESYQVHGISPKDVADKPTFAEVAEEILNFIGDADLAGYNSNFFDIPMLEEELHRTGHTLDMSNRKTIDVQKIFYKMEPRTLSAAYQYYCGEKMQDAHDALADVRATVAVLKGQLKMYKDKDYEDRDGDIHPRPVQNDMEKLQTFSNDPRYPEGTKRLILDKEGNVLFNFGKYRKQKVGEVCYKDRNYCNWILDKDFSIRVKQIVKTELNKVLKSHGEKEK